MPGQPLKSCAWQAAMHLPSSADLTDKPCTSTPEGGSAIAAHVQTHLSMRKVEGGCPGKFRALWYSRISRSSTGPLSSFKVRGLFMAKSRSAKGSGDLRREMWERPERWGLETMADCSHAGTLLPAHRLPCGGRNAEPLCACNCGGLAVCGARRNGRGGDKTCSEGHACVTC